MVVIIFSQLCVRVCDLENTCVHLRVNNTWNSCVISVAVCLTACDLLFVPCVLQSLRRHIQNVWHLHYLGHCKQHQFTKFCLVRPNNKCASLFSQNKKTTQIVYPLRMLHHSMGETSSTSCQNKILFSPEECGVSDNSNRSNL